MARMVKRSPASDTHAYRAGPYTPLADREARQSAAESTRNVPVPNNTFLTVSEFSVTHGIPIGHAWHVIVQAGLRNL